MPAAMSASTISVSKTSVSITAQTPSRNPAKRRCDQSEKRHMRETIMALHVDLLLFRWGWRRWSLLPCPPHRPTCPPNNPIRILASVTALKRLTKEHIRPLVELNDRINGLLSRESKINPTCIVVAGDQSHGKTSLLEALSGVDLPRGEGIQTRVPLILMLRCATGGDEHALVRCPPFGDWERIALDGGIADKVREYTNRAAGEEKEIKDSPIELRVFRNNQDDLTLTDLPGITRVAITGQGNDDKLEELIKTMYHKYLSRDNTIILNVASANMDICTSESVKISRKLDKTGERTMLCITKVDEHASMPRLNKEIRTNIKSMGLNPRNVFAVRNRSQDENDEGVALQEVRKMERQHLEELAEERGSGDDCDGGTYGLGVEALAKRLVAIQLSQILQTMPTVQEAIGDRIQDLQRKLDKIGRPIGDATACRGKILHGIEASVTQLQDEVLGRSPQRMGNEAELKAGTMFEISLTIDDFKEIRRQELESPSRSVCATTCVGGFDFQFSIHPQYNSERTVAGFLRVKPQNSVEVKSFVAAYSIAGPDGAFHESKFKERAGSLHAGKLTLQIMGTEQLMEEEAADDISGQAIFVASVFVEKIEIERSPTVFAAESHVLLCSTLNTLQEGLVSSIDNLYSNHYFFSPAFRLKLAHEVLNCRGGIGLPGAIAPHIPIKVLKELRQGLPKIIESYRKEVQEACSQKIELSIKTYFEEYLYPNLHRLIWDVSAELIDKSALSLSVFHANILEWEESISSSNHYFMDTVQSIRSSLSDDEEERPAYLQHLSDQKIKKMSNEDQRIVDMQIELFAYWKMMKKRLVDYVIMSTHSELVNKLITTKLKPTWLEATMAPGNDEMVKLLDPDPQVVLDRRDAMECLSLLQKAKAEVEEHDKKMLLSWCG